MKARLTISLLISLSLVLAALLLGSAGCRSSQAGPTSEEAVQQIVVLAKKECCECTQKRIDGSMAALNEALGDRKIEVVRVDVDVDDDKAESYRKLKPVMALPGLYFLDAEGKLVEMLQGEVTEEQIAKVLDR